MNMERLYKEVAQLMLTLKQCVVFSGAGISAESGIPTFRSKGGLWEKYDPAIYASIEVFRADYFIEEKAGTALPKLVSEIESILQKPH
jgi:hypothetical protein